MHVSSEIQEPVVVAWKTWSTGQIAATTAYSGLGSSQAQLFHLSRRLSSAAILLLTGWWDDDAGEEWADIQRWYVAQEYRTGLPFRTTMRGPERRWTPLIACWWWLYDDGRLDRRRGLALRGRVELSSGVSCTEAVMQSKPSLLLDWLEANPNSRQ